MKTRFEKYAGLLGSGLLALTLTACGADDDTSPVPEEPNTEQFEEFQDEPAPDSQNNEDIIDEDDGAPGPGTSEGVDPDTAPEEGETDDSGTQHDDDDKEERENFGD